MSTALDEDIVLVEDLDFDVTCDIPNVRTGDPCGHHAQWLLTFKCCGSTNFSCEDHRQRIIMQVQNWPVVHCDYCGFVWRDGDALKDLDWTPL